MVWWTSFSSGPSALEGRRGLRLQLPQVVRRSASNIAKRWKVRPRWSGGVTNNIDLLDTLLRHRGVIRQCRTSGLSFQIVEVTPQASCSPVDAGGSALPRNCFSPSYQASLLLLTEPTNHKYPPLPVRGSMRGRQIGNSSAADGDISASSASSPREGFQNVSKMWLCEGSRQQT